jgi:hypothetical protein
MYRAEASSVVGFVQQLATVYVRSGYVRAAAGLLPEGKSPVAFDRKQIERYGLDPLTPRERLRRKRAGLGNVQYLRVGRVFVILGTDGEHEMFDSEEGRVVRDLREKPLLVCGYSLRVREGHVHVRIAEREFLALKGELREVALRGSAEHLAYRFWSVPWEPYAPVRGQLFGLLSMVNEKRRPAGLPLVRTSAVRLRRQLVRPFEPLIEQEAV